MLIQFSIRNVRVFKEKATFSLIASNYDKETLAEDNVHSDEHSGFRLLKSAVIYGANASGKSKLIEALGFMKYFVLNSSKESQMGEFIDVHPFRLSEETENEPCEFEVIFLYDHIKYRYGFEASRDKIVSEWLYFKPKTKEVEIFYREGHKTETHKDHFSKGRNVAKEGLVRDNALLVSVAAQFNEKSAISVIEWFKKLKIISGLVEPSYRQFTVERIKNPDQRLKVLELLKAADLGIHDLRLQQLDVEKFTQGLPKELRDKILKESREGNTFMDSEVITTHKKYNSKKKVTDQVSFSMEIDESSGTDKFFALTGPILDVLSNGHTLVVDELDSKLHPNLVCKIISLFNSQDQNQKNAQLIFNTHDTNLLSSGLFRRDQIWFTEKDKYGESRLYSLADFKSEDVRKTEPFEENYLKGKYGAVPFLGFFDLIKLSKP